MKLSNPPTREQLLELQALPHGEANKVLKKTKLWNEARDPSLFPFDVVIRGYLIAPEVDEYDYEYDDVSGEAVVYASDLDAARKKAELLQSDEIDWDLPVAVECDMLDDWIIVSVSDAYYD